MPPRLLTLLANPATSADPLPPQVATYLSPLLHLDARADLVQCIKLCEQIMGRGSERTRPPRPPLAGAGRMHVERLMKMALETRPSLKLAAE